MNLARSLALGAVLAAAVVPEIGRYRGERELYRARAVLETVLARPATDPGRSRALDASAALALDAAHRLGGDPRALLVAGAARLVERRAEEALVHYRAALALGERAEIDLNLGRAHAILDRRPEAFAAFVRAVWITPALASALPEAARAPVAAEIERISRRLAEGHLELPALDR